MHIPKEQLEDLIKGCLKNDRKSQEALYKLFYEDMLRVCYRYLKSVDLAAEVVNTGFLKVFMNVAEYSVDKGELSVWIRTIMIRCAIDLQRKEIRFKSYTGEGYKEESAFIEPEILEKLNVEDLLYRINELPDASRMVFNLSVIDGYSHREIGEQLDISEGTSRWHLSEAKKRLKQLLQNPKTNSSVNPFNHRTS